MGESSADPFLLDRWGQALDYSAANPPYPSEVSGPAPNLLSFVLVQGQLATHITSQPCVGPSYPFMLRVKLLVGFGGSPLDGN